ncbi:hypothetical protein [Ammonifex thiophilus]|uniref:GGDEF domain-containing protein n=1 Tax=Ammonifex thiophilus TaxID=444093 RepID=A0A3D8P3T2_9THEO|nr:hypothetical protein [Ammonifex thiophilus]RDV83588.1 hypothetical protein DXX99_04630 [Ammonifex thiophilus]
MLDEITESLERDVESELGVEVLLRAAGSRLEFLVPDEEEGKYWQKKIKQRFFERTGSSLVATAASPVKVKGLLTEFQEVLRRANRELEKERNLVFPVAGEALPFEERCSICKKRVAEGWYQTPEKQLEPACRVCYTKREKGRELRCRMVKKLGEEVVDREAFVRLEPPDSLNELPPENLAHKWVAVVYGDGNNFGGVLQQKIDKLASALQWTQRIKRVTWKAAAQALREAMNSEEASRELKRLPFQMLLLGGEDISLFAWGPVGLHFARYFVELTDREFAPAQDVKGRISFSLGVLVTDEKAPVFRTLNFTEEELLKWAKRAARERGYERGGTIAFFLAPSADQIPGDLDDFLRRAFLKPGKVMNLCLTLRPLSAEELGFLIDKARELRSYSGSLLRLATAFVKGSPKVATLLYLYQKERKREKGLFDELEKREKVPPTLRELMFPTFFSPERKVFGVDEQKEGFYHFSVLVDLAELLKILG